MKRPPRTLLKFWCWRESQDREEGRQIEACDAAFAAEDYVDQVHKEEGEWSLAEVVKLVEIGLTDVRTFKVEAQAIPHYHAAELTPTNN